MGANRARSGRAGELKRRMYDTRNPKHDFNYEMLLSVAGGKATIRIEELGLIASGTSVDAAYAEIERLKREYLDKARAADLLDTLPVPGRRTGTRPVAMTGTTTIKGDIPSFLIKFAIVMATIVILLGAAGIAIRSSLHMQTGKAFWTKAQEQLHKAARG